MVNLTVGQVQHLENDLSYVMSILRWFEDVGDETGELGEVISSLIGIKAELHDSYCTGCE